MERGCLWDWMAVSEHIFVICCGSKKSSKILFSRFQLIDSCHGDSSIKGQDFTEAIILSWPRCLSFVCQCFQGVQFLFFPFFSYFLSLFLFSPIFKLKPPIFPIFLAGEGKICNKLENGIITVCVFEWDYIIKQVVCWLWCSNISENNSYVCSFRDIHCLLEFC